MSSAARWFYVALSLLALSSRVAAAQRAAPRQPIIAESRCVSVCTMRTRNPPSAVARRAMGGAYQTIQNLQQPLTVTPGLPRR